jgi:ELWxxDGT repeat protein
MAGYQDALNFQGNDGHTGSELWRVSKGSAPSQVVNLAPGPQSSRPHAFVVFQNRLHFAASTPATGEELYRYDGQSVAPAALRTVVLRWFERRHFKALASEIRSSRTR